MGAPNVLLIMTDEERYPPPYETAEVARFRAEQLPARARVREGGVELHRHYVGSTACVPSRATLFTGQYPSLHGVSQTDGVAKEASDPAMRWLQPGVVPTLGDWFRAGGYQTHYRGKWHITHADLPVEGSDHGLAASDDDGNVIAEAVAAYLAADRLDPLGFSGWIGREPHGSAKSNSGTVRDGIFADQVIDLFDQLAQDPEQPWLAVASFVNPHDISFAGGFYELLLGFEPSDDTVPSIPEPPSQQDGFGGRPRCQEQFKAVWPQMIAPQPADDAYRRLYYYLHKLVDQKIAAILDALDASGMADDTIVVLTSDHGDLLGAHGGLQQKWANAFDEATRVPMVVKGPGVTASGAGIDVPTSHVDLIPTLLGLAGIDADAAAARLGTTHREVRPFPGRDLSPVLSGAADATEVAEPIYFMTDDDVTWGARQANVLTGDPFDAIEAHFRIESVVASLPTGPGDAPALWKLVHYHDGLPDWHAERGAAVTPPIRTAGPAEWELHNLTDDPEERHNRCDDAPEALAAMQAILADQRDRKRLLPAADVRSGEAGHRG